MQATTWKLCKPQNYVRGTINKKNGQMGLFMNNKKVGLIHWRELDTIHTHK